jgi:lysyl-tRNA synthetase class 1
MVRHAFRVLTEDRIKTRLLHFPTTWTACARCRTTVPNRDMMAAHLGKPLTRVPDPFSNEHPSFGPPTMRAARVPRPFRLRLRVCLFDRLLHVGRFDATLLKMLAAYDKVMAIILPTLGPDRRATYSPFLPISKTPASCCRCR